MLRREDGGYPVCPLHDADALTLDELLDSSVQGLLQPTDAVEVDVVERQTAVVFRYQHEGRG